MSMMKNKNVAVYVTGGIAAYKAVSFVRLLVKAGANVKVAMTKSATEFVTPLTFQVVSRQEVYMDTFSETFPERVNHIYLSDWADISIMVPLTANTLAKIANGIADNFVTSAWLATNTLRIVAPAMNEKMLEHPATKRNIQQLQEDGIHVIESAYGFLAEGYEGKGRLPEPEQLVNQVEAIAHRHFSQQLLQGKKVLISAGGTRERIDPVRYITNDSSGKMGYALAKAAYQLGAEVLLVSTTKGLSVPIGVNVIYVESATQLYDVMQQEAPHHDMVVMAAAVSDFRVESPAEQKMKKKDEQDGLTISLVKNPDILQSLGEKKKSNQFIVGFAAETQDVISYAKEKLNKKKADAIIANDVSDTSIGFNSQHNAVTILTATGNLIELEKQEKTELARTILSHLCEEWIKKTCLF